MKNTLLFFLLLFFSFPFFSFTIANENTGTCNQTFQLPGNKWRQISLPCQPGKNATVADVFGDDIATAFGNDKTPEYGSNWVLYRYNPHEGYQKVAETEQNTLQQGIGYWIIQTSENDATLDLPADSTASIPTSSTGCLESAPGCFEIPLATASGSIEWNMIGYPNTNSQGLANVRILTNDAGICSEGCTLDAAKTNHLAHNQLWTYDDQGYSIINNSEGNLDPWKGYWAASLEQANGKELKLLIPGTETTVIKAIKIPTKIPFSAGQRGNVSAISGQANKIASTRDGIISMITSAVDGDRIAIADGTYDIGILTLKAARVQLFAINKGKVIFNGHSKLVLEGDNIVLEGFVFEEGDLDIGFAAQAILVKGDDVHISQCEFLRWGLHAYETTPMANKAWTIVIEINQYANKTEISDSYFTDLYGISILKGQAFIPNFSSGKGLWVHHNDWIDNPYRPGLGSGGEALHAGVAWSTAQGVPGEGNYDDDLVAIFEYNHIIRHFAEFEIVSLKSSGNIIRNNIVEDSQFAGFVIRMGNENLIYGNWMTGVTRSAVRISGERNIVAFNYFKSNSTQHGIIELHSETNFETISPGLIDSYWAANQARVHRNIIEHAPYFVSILQSAPTDPLIPEVATSPNYPFVSSPKDGVYSQNIFLDKEEHIDISGASQIDFLSENTLKDNPIFTKKKNEWKTKNPISFDPLKPLEIDTNWKIYGVQNQLYPPDWWSELYFN